MSRVHRYVSNDFTVRAAVVDASPVVIEMQNILGGSILPTVAVGQTMVGAILMAAQLKEQQEVGVYFKGNGGLGSIYAQASYEGHVRGYTPFLNYEPPNYDNGFKLKEHIGHGTLTVVRHQPFQRQPFQGVVPIVSGEIGEDLAHYLHQSQQIRSVLNLGVYIDTYGKVRSAGGVLIEVMPGVEDEVVDKIQKNFEKIGADKNQTISQLILDNKKPTEILEPYLIGIPFTEIPHDHELKYACPCTLDRVKDSMLLFEQADFDDIIAKNEVTDITCQMCGKHYQLSVEDIKEIKSKQYKNSLN